MNGEAYLVAWLNAQKALGVPASLDVPTSPPSEYVTVERVGGSSTPYSDSPVLAVQCWAATRLRAAMLADRVRGLLHEELPFAPPVRRVAVTGCVNFPLNEMRPRYQITVELTIQY